MTNTKPFYIQKAEELGLIEVNDGKIDSVKTEACDKIISVARIVDKLQPTTAQAVEDTLDQEAIVLSRVLSGTSVKAKEYWSELRTAFGVKFGEMVSPSIWSDARFKQIAREIDMIFIGDRDVELIEPNSILTSYESIDESNRSVPVTDFAECLSQLKDPDLIKTYGKQSVEWDTSLDVLKQVRAKGLLAEVIHETKQLNRSETKLSDVFEHLAVRASEGIGILRGSLGGGGGSVSILESIIGNPGGTTLNWIDNLSSQEELIKPATTGITAVDIDLGGGVKYVQPHKLSGGRLLTLAARTKLGKTGFGVQIATSLATQGLKVGFVSLELSRDQIEPRILSSLSKKVLPSKDYHYLKTLEKTGYFCVSDIVNCNPSTADDITRLLHGVAEGLLASGGMIQMVYPSKADLPTVCSDIRLMKAQHPELRAIVLDHFHYMQSHQGCARDESVMLKDRAYALNDLAKECDVDLFLLAQMNQVGLKRDAQNLQQQQREPQLDEIRGTDALGHVSHAVWLLRKHKASENEQNVPKNSIELWHSAYRAGQQLWLAEGDSYNCIQLDGEQQVGMSLVQLDYSTQSIKSDNTLTKIDLLKHRSK